MCIRDRGCGVCQCSKGCVDKDDTNPTIDKIAAADMILFATPVYWSYSLTDLLKLKAPAALVTGACGSCARVVSSFQGVFFSTSTESASKLFLLIPGKKIVFPGLPHQNTCHLMSYILSLIHI